MKLCIKEIYGIENGDFDFQNTPVLDLFLSSNANSRALMMMNLQSTYEYFINLDMFKWLFEEYVSELIIENAILG